MNHLVTATAMSICVLGSLSLPAHAADCDTKFTLTNTTKTDIVAVKVSTPTEDWYTLDRNGHNFTVDAGYHDSFDFADNVPRKMQLRVEMANGYVVMQRTPMDFCALDGFTVWYDPSDSSYNLKVDWH